MGWFSEQIKDRIKNDDDEFASAFASLTNAVTGKGILDEKISGSIASKNAIDQIIGFYRVKAQTLPADIKDVNGQLEFLLRPSGLMRRAVALKGKWYRDAVGAMLVKTAEGELVALLPGLCGYYYLDRSGKRVRVNAKNCKKLGTEAICFYKPFPLKALTVKEIGKYVLGTVTKSDVLLIVLATLAVTLMGLFMPYLNQLLFEYVVPSGQTSTIMPMAALFVGVSISTMLIGICKKLINSRLETKIDLCVESAAMMRTLSLPAAFFKDYSAGELAMRLNSIAQLIKMLSNAVLTIGLSSLFSLIYIGQIFTYAPSMAAPAFLIILATAVWSVLFTFLNIKISKKIMHHEAKNNGLMFGLVSGVQKIKLAGAEKRVFANWAKEYAEEARLYYNPPWYIKYESAISSAINGVGILVIYFVAAASGVSVAEYMAFNVSYGMIAGAFLSLTAMVSIFGSIKPTYEMAKPLLQTYPKLAETNKWLPDCRAVSN